MAKPLSQKEIKKDAEDKNNVVFKTVMNKSRQAITVQLRAPKGVDFFTGEQTISILPGKTAKLPEHRIYKEQLTNHQKAGRIIVY